MAEELTLEVGYYTPVGDIFVKPLRLDSDIEKGFKELVDYGGKVGTNAYRAIDAAYNSRNSGGVGEFTIPCGKFIVRWEKDHHYSLTY
jgi:hypothetical protein